MSIPITGYVLIPLGLLLAVLPWRYGLTGLVTFAMLSPAAVINAGHFGLQPGYYLAMLLIARAVLEIASRGFVLNGFVLRRMRLLFLLLTLSFLVLFVALAFFQGSVDTLPGTAGFKSNALQPFRIARENYTQLAYLILNTLLVYVLGHRGAKEEAPVLMKTWDAAFVLAIGFAIAVCFWQFVSQFGGPAFPSDFFYSNVGYSRADQTMAGILRVSGPFEEPSTVGYAFTGFLLFSWARYRLYPTALSALLVAGCMGSMIVSTSTTAFLGLFLFASAAGYDVLAGRIHLLTRSLSGGQLAAMAIAIIAVIALAIAVAAKGPEIYVVLKNTVFEKGESTSFQERSFADLQAMRIVVETYGLGIGLGSHKANSLILTLASNLGIAGFAVFSAFLLGLFSGRSHRQLTPFQWGLGGHLAIHAFSNPNLSTQILWVSLGGVLALQCAYRRTPAKAPESVETIEVELPERERRYAV